MSMDILGKLSQIENQKNILKEKFSLNYNPFPKSGIAIINESDDIVSSLSPVNDEVVNTIFEYIKDALYNSASNGKNSDNKYISFESINPGLEVTGNLVFEIPKDITVTDMTLKFSGTSLFTSAISFSLK